MKKERHNQRSGRMIPPWSQVMSVPTRKDFVEAGLHTLRYKIGYRAEIVDNGFYAWINLRMKPGCPGAGADANRFDERDPDAFVRWGDGFIHPYILELAQSRYVIQGGDEPIILRLVSKNEFPPMRCFMLQYEDLQNHSRGFLREDFPIHSMRRCMDVPEGGFAHNPEQSYIAQGIAGDDGSPEEILIGEKPFISPNEIDMEKGIALVTQPGWLAVLQNDFYKKVMCVDSLFQDGPLPQLMQAMTDGEYRTYADPQYGCGSADARGLGPSVLVKTCYHGRADLQYQKQQKKIREPPSPA